jgi:parallel beta-helix repeat protein
LTADLTFDGSGIIIGADKITLDLGGHTLTGPGKGPWIWPEPALSSVGIQLTDRKGITIRNGQVKEFSTGLLIETSEGIVVQDITSSLNHYGIYLWNSDNNILRENNVTSNIYGLHLMGSRENRIVKNHMFDNHYNSPGGYGICLIASSSNTVTENTIDSNGTQGIWLIESRDNLITENTIDSNQAQGIWLAESGDNLLYHNNVMGNQPNAVNEPSMNVWYDPASQEGNYWDDYAGEDSDGDGIGDTPYQFYDEGQDPYPFVRPDGWARVKRDE